MSNWDDDDFMGGDDNTTNNIGGGNWDDDGDWGESAAPTAAVDSWDADDWEKPKETKTTAGPSKKTLKQIAKEKEEQEKAAKIAAQKQIHDEQLLLEQDPEYRAKKREADRKRQEQGELDSISDLFGSDVAKPTQQAFRKEANPDRARELAAMTGLGDGAGDVCEAAKNNDWDEVPHVDREGPAPGSLDALPFTTDADMTAFTKVLAAKIKAVGTTKTTNNSQTFSKALLVELIRTIGPDMKSQDVDEVLRVATVVKNDLTKKTQNVKKGKNKKQVKLHDNGRDYSDEEGFM